MVEWRNIPNILTIGRIILVLPIVVSICFESFRQALLLFLIAGVSDGVDGYLARRFDWKSRFGSIADPLADKLLLVSSYLAITAVGLVDWWLALIVLGRDFVILVGAGLYHYFYGRYEITPSLLGKSSTLCQIVYVLVVIMYAAQWPMPELAVQSGKWLVAFISLASGLAYLWVWGRKALIARGA
ncbi:MAG: CDP-alcohol phosphatidyltransferase [Proteobacteria bacterium]|nr:MAG: CDP-alcohol phosphatidyltransferase [Pseudomonadota bacterium]